LAVHPHKLAGIQINPTYFREAKRGDEAVLTLLAQQTIATCYRRFLGVKKVVEFLECGSINEYVVENLEKNYCPILLLDRLPVGFAVCRDNTIDLIIVDYRYHRRGFGTQLLAHCESELFGAYPAIALSCFARNEHANRFFRKHGWTQTLAYRDKQIGVRTILYQKLWRNTLT